MVVEVVDVSLSKEPNNKVEDLSAVTDMKDVSAMKETTDAEVKQSNRTTILQVVNSISFVICMVLNATAQKFTQKLSDISDDWDIAIQPKGWAFSIWGFIYTFVAIFALY